MITLETGIFIFLGIVLFVPVLVLGRELTLAYFHGRRFKKNEKTYKIYKGLLKLGFHETAYIYLGNDFDNLSDADLLWIYLEDC